VSFNYNHLYYFHVVATEGSLAKASRVLGVTQPTISEQIKQLEEDLGAQLFERPKGGGLVLNQTGRRVIEHTTVIFHAAEHLRRAFLKDSEWPDTVLQIGVSTSVSRHFAAEFFLPMFDDDSLRPRIRVSDEAGLLRSLAAMELDIVLSDTTPHHLESIGLKSTVVYAPPLAAVASPDLAEKISEFPRDAGSVPAVFFTTNTRLRFQLESYFRDRALSLDVVGEVDDIELMKAATVKGVGLSFLPAPFVEKNVNEGSLTLLGTIGGITCDVHAVYHQRETPARVLRAIEILSQAAGYQHEQRP